MIRSFYNYYISGEKELARKLNDLLGFTPKNIRLFKRAFSHKSLNSLADQNTKYSSNERLEYLGDAILSTVVAEYLYKKYPIKDEGFLTKMRSKIVKRKSLNLIADRMGLDLILSDYSQGKMSQSMLGNAFEALIGAIYLEYGYNRTRDYIIKSILMQHINMHELEEYDDNFKSRLLEWAQKSGRSIEYKLVAKTKLHKRDRFKVAVLIDGNTIASAEDFNKKSAEQSASSQVINKLDIKTA